MSRSKSAKYVSLHPYAWTGKLTSDVVTQFLESTLASSTALAIWRSHVRWKVAKNIAESHFVVDHLVLESRGIQAAQILM